MAKKQVKSARERQRDLNAQPVRASLDVRDTGVPGLNEVLGGGLPSYSFTLIAGEPGTGKTTLAMQMLFSVSTPKRPGLYITLLGETSLKMLRYQQQFTFFDMERVGKDIHFLNLTEEALSGDLDVVLAHIVSEVGHLHPGVVVVDSFRSLVRAREPSPSDLELERFVQRLSLHLTAWEISAFLIGEYESSELRNPVFTVADGILWLTQAVDRNSVVRKLQVVKMRGTDMMPGLHTIRMSRQGVRIFPRIPGKVGKVNDSPGLRLSTGIAGLDEMMCGGIPAGDSLILAGQTGTGKTSFAMQFVAAGLREGEAVVIAIFEEHPEVYISRAKTLGVNLKDSMKKGKLRIIYLRPLDLSVDETLDEIRSAVVALGATRVVIDSISGFEMALAPTFREDFRESLYRLIGALTNLGTTIFSTVEVKEGNQGLQLTGYQVSFLTDDIISQRYVEIEGELRKVMVIVKMRGSDHNRGFRTYEMTASGVVLREFLRDYDGIVGGAPQRMLRAPQPEYRGLVDREVLVIEALSRAGAEQTATQLSVLTGLDVATVETILARLIQLRFAVRKGQKYEPDFTARLS